MDEVLRILIDNGGGVVVAFLVVWYIGRELRALRRDLIRLLFELARRGG